MIHGVAVMNHEDACQYTLIARSRLRIFGNAAWPGFRFGEKPFDDAETG